MKPQSEKNAGTALIVFTLLMVFTMILHPAGGSFEHLLKIKQMIIITHVIAILSVPFAAVGFQGLTKKVGADNFFSISAFAIVLFSLVAVMLAAAANGLVLPIFIGKYSDATAEVISSIKPILRYNTSVNNAFDFIFTGGFCLSMLFWSIAIIKTKTFPVWIAWFGILLPVAAAVLFISGFAMTSLQGFRIFVSTIIVWILLVGILLRKT
jgi:hypothetical protein